VCAPLKAHAQLEHQLIRRVVVFPIKAEKADDVAAEEAWWQARDELSKSHRFLVASKQFLIKSDVYQARGTLEPADAVILGKLLDAHALITFQLTGRVLTTNVYDGGNGLMLWTKAVALHPALTVGDQLPALARKVIDDFFSSISYQGFTLTDALIGQTVYEEGDVKLAQVDLGINTGAQIGDVVQWIRINATTALPLFQGGSKITVFAEGKIVRLDQGIGTVEVVRATKIKDVQEFSLVRIPREADRLKAEFTISDHPKSTLNAELVAPEANPMEAVAKERRPLVTTMSSLASVAAFLLLAF
jgi:hypothetical protein